MLKRRISKKVKVSNKNNNENKNLDEILGNSLIDKEYEDLDLEKYDIKDVLDHIKLKNIAYDISFIESILYFISCYYDKLEEKIYSKYKNTYHYKFQNTLNLLKFLGKDYIEPLSNKLLELKFMVGRYDNVISEPKLFKEIFDYIIANMEIKEEFIEKLFKLSINIITRYFLNSFYDHNKILPIKFLHNLIEDSYTDDNEDEEEDEDDEDEDEDEDDAFILDEDKDDEEIIKKNNEVCIDTEMTEIYTILFEKMKIVPDEDLCNQVIEKHDEEFFKYLLSKNLLKVSNKSLKYAYKNSSYYMISNLINMKYMPTLDDFKELECQDEKIIKLSLMMGIKIDYNLIAHFILKDIYFKNLENYNLTYGEELYFECFKTTGLCVTKYCKPLKNECNRVSEIYISKMNPDIVKFRYDFKVKNLDELKNMIMEKKLVVDQYCYDYSFENENWESIVEWLEKDFKLKPTILTIVRLKSSNNGNWRIREKSYTDAEQKRIQIYNKYFCDNLNCHSDINVKDIYINKTLYENNLQNLIKKPEKKITKVGKVNKIDEKLTPRAVVKVAPKDYKIVKPKKKLASKKIDY